MFRRDAKPSPVREDPTKVDETVPKLKSLAPEYSFHTHGMYFTILRTALLEQPAVRNIALAGTYGTGKSSILRRVAEEFADRVVELSLLSLGSDPGAAQLDPSMNPAAASKTNRIQKEIVKQLLYQQRPHRAPESRFRRIVRYRRGPEIGIGLAVASVAVALALLAGLDVVTTPSLGFTITDRPRWVPVVAMFVFLGMIAGGTALLIRSIARGRLGIERVSAGPATISLSPRSTSYFDEYLDEIIYFFEANPKRDIVIIEDLDRFDDPNIFESLRSLNGLLNAAEQLDNRNIRFIYAMRDSVFEKLGQEAPVAASDEARAELVRANRTKFFELLVPVVPFITHRNARDLMQAELEARGHRVSKDLVHLAARHLADMRLVHNVLNEYEVFKHRLLDVDTPVPGLDPERLFAMVVFKNAHMGDFEKVRLGSSSLDALWDTWRQLVQGNIDELRKDSLALRTRIASRVAEEGYAASLGAALRQQVDALASAPGSGLSDAVIHFNGSPVDERTLSSAGLWRSIVETGEPLTLNVYRNGQWGTGPMSLSRESIEALLGMSVDSNRFVDGENATDRAKVAQNDRSVAFLQRHTWQELAETEYGYSGHGEKTEKRSFGKWARHHLPSRLATDLVLHGYITSYFALHVSAFYGQLIRPDAMLYVLKSVERGTPDAEYPLDREDVEAILRDQGKVVLSEKSMFNVGILDHLLESRPADASVIVRSLLAANEEGAAFIDLYFTSGRATSGLAAQLCPHMPNIFTYLAESTAVEDGDRALLIDEAIRNRAPAIAYSTSDTLVALLQNEFRSLPSLVTEAGEEQQVSAVAYLASTGAVVESIADMPPAATEAFTETRAYALNLTNLQALAWGSDISLDALLARGGDVLEYAIEEIGAYLVAYESSGRERPTVSAVALLERVLNEAEGWSRKDLDLLLANAEPSSVVQDLRRVDPSTWPALFNSRHAAVTLPNVLAYLEVYALVDNDLGAALAASDDLADRSDAELSDRTLTALAIINARTDLLTPEHRVALAAVLDTGELPASSVEPLSGPLVGLLIESGLVADGPDAFASRLMVDWRTQARAIEASTQFSTLVSSSTLQSEFLENFFEDSRLAELHSIVGSTLSFYTGVSVRGFEAAAARAVEGSFPIALADIQLFSNGGVSPSTTIRLLNVALDQATDDDVRAVMRSLGEPWSKVADPGWGVHTIDEVPGLEGVLLRLQGAGVVSKLPLDGTVRRVSLRHPGV